MKQFLLAIVVLPHLAAAQININDIHCARSDTFFTLGARMLVAPVQDSSRHTHPAHINCRRGIPNCREIIIRGNDTITIDPQYHILGTTPFYYGEHDENLHLHFLADTGEIIKDAAWTFRIGPGPGDTVSNPIITADDFILDSVFWYSGSNYTSRGTNLFYCFYDTGTYTPDSLGYVGYADSITYGLIATHTSDPAFGLISGDSLLIAQRVTWKRGVNPKIKMSAIYVTTTGNFIEYTPWRRITHLGKWMSPAIDRDRKGNLAMFCSVERDECADIADEATVYKFMAHESRWDTIWEYTGPLTIQNLPARHKIWHLSIGRPFGGNPIMVLDIQDKVSKGHNIYLSDIDVHGLFCSVAKYPLFTDENVAVLWDRNLYQTVIYGINSSSLGIIYSGYARNDSIVFHIGYTEAMIETEH